MAIAWLSMLQAFEAAALHVQVQIHSVVRASELSAQAHGTIVRVFKGDRDLMGAAITLSLACYDEASAIPLGGDHFIHIERLHHLRVIECFSDVPCEGAIAPLYSFFEQSGAPSDEPIFALDKELSAAREATARARARVMRARLMTLAALLCLLASLAYVLVAR